MADVKRRDVLRYGAAGAATAASALVGAQALASPEAPAPGPTAKGRKAGPDPDDFNEVYRGKRIRGRYKMGVLGNLDLGNLKNLGADITRTLGLARQNEVFVNNRALAMTAIPTMFFPTDGRKPYVGIGLISAINHYDPVELEPNADCLRSLGKKVVDILGDLELSGESAEEHTH
ncbi:tyrosinase family oxidase copper chaperone [Actinoplanes couchii]|uniref:Tyrosinase co-factor MelC1 n=1 Tax=Actinoplanes couchii TaxID=403638 RepID=A0ABQ3XK98_9ACTN|nr:tyrosinase family oxidase copper chaperone [Actinoplanes couchii]MDR6320517.1 hypothetical protein [Actinoplanes couchii]GID58922.1 hypothetical protein Aco03nite_073260 [Actinoplanes couchii]